MGSKGLVLLAALALSLDGAGDAALDRATLRGITAINVVTDPVAPEIGKEGATADTLRQRLEQRLREAGIQIDPSSNVFVALRLTGVQAGHSKFSMRAPFAIAASIGLYQPVTLVREPDVKTATQTWEVDTVVLADPKQVDQACLDSVDQLAARFVTAYRSVNK